MKTILLIRVCICLAVLAGASGCVTKSEAQRRAHAAYLAGQQETLLKMQQSGNIVVSGAVRRPFVPWTEDMTLAKAIVSANYFGPDPKVIVIVRNGEAIPVDPAQLLGGNDIPLRPGDIVKVDPEPGE